MSDVIKWCVNMSPLAAATNNPIRNLVESLDINPHPDKQMIALSIGDPTTFGNLKAPIQAVEAVCESAKDTTKHGYAPAMGHLTAREAVAAYSSVRGVTVSPADVILASGCSSAIDLAISVLAAPGSNILVPRPGFSIYKTLAEGLGIYVKYYDLKPQCGWEADIEDLDARIDEDTACLIINNPSNPCGSVYSAKHLTELLNVARSHRIPIIADEIYEHLVFPGSEYHPIASLSVDVPILSCSGLTKRFLVPGWRMGWIIVHDRGGIFHEIRVGLNKLSQRVMGSNTIIQGALPYILTKTPNKFFQDTINTLHRHASYLYRRLSEVPGLHPVMPQGAMYMMVRLDISEFKGISSSIEFVEKLVAEESVFCLPGDCFQCPSYLRLVLTAPEPMLAEACDRIENFCKNHYITKTISTGKWDGPRSEGLRKSLENSARQP